MASSLCCLTPDGQTVALTPGVSLPPLELSGRLQEKARGPGAQAGAGARPGKPQDQPGLAVWTAVWSSTGLSQRPAEQESQPGATPRGLRRDWLQERDGPQQEPRARNQG